MEACDRDLILSNWTDVSFVYSFGYVHERGTNQQLRIYSLLAVGNPEEVTVSCPRSHEPERELTAIDLPKSVKFKEGAHVFMVACGSGVDYPALEVNCWASSPLGHVGARSATSTLGLVVAVRAEEWTRFMVDEWKMLRGMERGLLILPDVKLGVEVERLNIIAKMPEERTSEGLLPGRKTNPSTAFRPPDLHAFQTSRPLQLYPYTTSTASRPPQPPDIHTCTPSRPTRPPDLHNLQTSIPARLPDLHDLQTSSTNTIKREGRRSPGTAMAGR
jgi:hypothetical protein